VKLDLSNNEIWDAWAREILKMELNGWVILRCSNNKLSTDMKKKLKEWEKSYQDKWINCKIII
jgi:hypothetical protein